MAEPFEPTDEQNRQVEALSGLGLPQEQIALIIGCDAKTLRKHFGEKLKIGEAKATAKVAQSLFQKAVSGEGKESVTAAIFWMKVRARWNEKIQLEHTGKDGESLGPLVQVYLPANGRDDNATKVFTPQVDQE